MTEIFVPNTNVKVDLSGYVRKVELPNYATNTELENVQTAIDDIKDKPSYISVEFTADDDNKFTLGNQDMRPINVFYLNMVDCKIVKTSLYGLYATPSGSSGHSITKELTVGIRINDVLHASGAITKLEDNTELLMTLLNPIPIVEGDKISIVHSNDLSDYKKSTLVVSLLLEITT